MNSNNVSRQDYSQYEIQVLQQQNDNVNLWPLPQSKKNSQKVVIENAKYYLNSPNLKKSSSTGNVLKKLSQSSQSRGFIERNKKEQIIQRSSPFDRIQKLISNKKDQRSPMRSRDLQKTVQNIKISSNLIENRRKIYNMPYILGNAQSSFPAGSNTQDFKAEIFYKEQKTFQRGIPNFSQTVSTNSSSHTKMQMRITDFILGKKLGAGKFGQVFLAKHKQTGFICAIKRVPKDNLDDVLTRQLIRQIKIQMFLNHPNIVKLYTFFADENCIYLIMELCVSGQLYHFLKNRKSLLSEQLCKVIIRQVCQGLDYIHENNIIHRDLKPENILYHNGMMKICDFGWSVDTHLMRDTFCGTPLYISPELLKRNFYDKKIDSWSLGVLSYQILLGRVPFEIYSEADYVKIVANQIRLPMTGGISQQAKHFLTWCLQKDPHKRLCTGQMLEHPFLSKVQIINFPEIF